MRTFAEAREYVGAGEAWQRVGAAQLAILRLHGLQPSHRVLDTGAGCLTAGRAILGYLDPGGYTALEPNRWLVDAALREVPGLGQLAVEKRLRLVERADFTVAHAEPFDYVISHSVLSHAAHWQLVQMLVALRPALAPEAKVIASLRIPAQDGPSSYDRTWQYPGNSFFSWADIQALAAGCGYAVEMDFEAQRIMLAAAANHVHEWVVFRRR